MTIFESYLNNRENDARMSIPLPGSWGIEYSQDKALYNYGTYYPYCILLGDIAKQYLHEQDNPFSSNSRVLTVASSGIDNLLIFLVHTNGFSQQLEETKFFDNILINYFYKLDGRKFSTSRNHAIWVDKISSKVSIDILRLYLLLNNSDETEGNFSLKEFVQFHNELIQDLHGFHWGNSSYNHRDIETYKRQLDLLLSPESFDGKSYAKICVEIIKRNKISSHEDSEINRFVKIIKPAMPSISEKIEKGIALNLMAIEEKDLHHETI